MRIKHLLHFVLLYFFLVSCEDFVDFKRQRSDLGNNILSSTTSLSAQMKNFGEPVPFPQNINQTSLQYYQYFDTVVFETLSNQLKQNFFFPYRNSSSSLNDNDNPFMAELEDIEIENLNGKKLSFFDLNEKEQHRFMNNWILYQAEQLSKKMAYSPELNDEVEKEVKAIKKALQLYRNKKFKSIMQFFYTVQNEIRTLTKRQQLIGDNKSKKDDMVSFPKTRAILAQYAAKGNLLVRLAKDGHEWTTINADNGSVGHVGILTGTVPEDVRRNYKIDIAANTHDPDGNIFRKVRKEELYEWQRTCYIMEIWDVKYTEFGKIKYRFPVFDQTLMAIKAESYIGIDYAYGADFAVANFIAPQKFTCSSLAWWCAKKMYGFDISYNHIYEPFSRVSISPEAIFRNHHTYIKTKIKE